MDSTAELLQRIMPYIEERLRQELEQGEPRSISEMEGRLRAAMQDIASFGLGR